MSNPESKKAMKAPASNPEAMIYRDSLDMIRMHLEAFKKQHPDNVPPQVQHALAQAVNALAVYDKKVVQA